MNVTRESLVGFLSSEFGLSAEEIEATGRLFSDGLLDSFNMVELIRYIEGEEGIRIEVMEVTLENLDSLDRILRFVAAKTADASG